MEGRMRPLDLSLPHDTAATGACKRKLRKFGVDRTGGPGLALVKEEAIGAETAEIERRQRRDSLAQLLQRHGFLDAGQSQMRAEWAAFRLEAQRVQCPIGFRRQGRQVRRSLNARPEYARGVWVGEETQIADVNRDR